MTCHTSHEKSSLKNPENQKDWAYAEKFLRRISQTRIAQSDLWLFFEWKNFFSEEAAGQLFYHLSTIQKKRKKIN